MAWSPAGFLRLKGEPGGAPIPASFLPPRPESPGPGAFSSPRVLRLVANSPNGGPRARGPLLCFLMKVWGGRWGLPGTPLCSGIYFRRKIWN